MYSNDDRSRDIMLVFFKTSGSAKTLNNSASHGNSSRYFECSRKM
jgi:hypothetical protein